MSGRRGEIAFDHIQLTRPGKYLTDIGLLPTDFILDTTSRRAQVMGTGIITTDATVVAHGLPSAPLVFVYQISPWQMYDPSGNPVTATHRPTPMFAVGNSGSVKADGTNLTFYLGAPTNAGLLRYFMYRIARP